MFNVTNLEQFFTQPFWQDVYWGNALLQYAMALGAFFLFYLFFAIFQKIILCRLKKVSEKTKNEIDDELIKIVKTIKPPFFSFLAFYLALQFLGLNDFLTKAINIILIIWVVYQIITVVQVFINFVVRKRFSEEDKQLRTAVSVISVFTKGALWVIATMMILANLGVNVTSLVAGMGIAGLAIAMALKNILGDLFGSFAIYFDKPFLVGDTIVFGDKEGKVEKIGIKTTRIRASSGEEVIIPNDKLTSSVVIKK